MLLLLRRSNSSSAVSFQFYLLTVCAGRGGSMKHKECVGPGFFALMTADNMLLFIKGSYKTWHVLSVGVLSTFQHTALCVQFDAKPLWISLRKNELKSVTNCFTGRINDWCHHSTEKIIRLHSRYSRACSANPESYYLPCEFSHRSGPVH